VFDETQIRARQDIKLEMRPIVKASTNMRGTQVSAKRSGPKRKGHVRNLLRIRDETTVGAPKVTLEFGFHSSELPKSGSDPSQDPGGEEIVDKKSQASPAPDRPAELDAKEDEVQSGLGHVRIKRREGFAESRDIGSDIPSRKET
jgi:hypothetical protein